MSLKPLPRKLRKIVSALLLLAFVTASAASASFAPLFPAKTAEAAAPDWMAKGVSMTSQWSGDWASENFRQSVRNAQDMGVNYIALVVPYIQSNPQASDIGNAPNTPSDETLVAAIQFIHSLGMKVALKPHLEDWTANWRGNIQASNRDEWYSKYSQTLNHLGDIAEQNGVELIVVGTELIGMASSYVNQDNTEQWRVMINSLRGHYSGPLTYSANWGSGSSYVNEWEFIKFWDALDFIGISAYFPHPNSDGSAASLEESWRGIDQRQVSRLQAQYNKPILFTEIGYKSIDGAWQQPWDSGRWGNYNGEAQANAFEGLFRYWDTNPNFAGVMIWDWHSDPNHGGQGNIDYSPHNKPAEAVIHDWFTRTGGGGGDPTDPPPVPAPTGDWSASSAGVSDARTGQNVAIPATVSITGSAQDVIVDFEVYDVNNNQVFQKFYEHQNIGSAGQNYTVDWTPSAAGEYTVKLGVFRNDWGENYYWSNSVTTIAVTNPGEPVPPEDPGPVDINIWWPGEGANVSGVQPFKAQIPGKDVSEYEMYWQVDGHDLVQMYNSDVDYPHKEFMTDLSGWTWKGEGPYNVTFVAKDHAGNVIAQKSVNIYVVTW